MRGRRSVVAMSERFADKVVVPDVVGLPFHVERDIAHECGVTLANPDPDGPPIGALGWPGLFYITSQNPPAETTLYRWDSVTVEISPPGDAESGADRIDAPSPSVDAAHAAPEPQQFVDLSQGDEDWATVA